MKRHKIELEKNLYPGWEGDKDRWISSSLSYSGINSILVNKIKGDKEYKAVKDIMQGYRIGIGIRHPYPKRKGLWMSMGIMAVIYIGIWLLLYWML